MGNTEETLKEHNDDRETGTEKVSPDMEVQDIKKNEEILVETTEVQEEPVEVDDLRNNSLTVEERTNENLVETMEENSFEKISVPEKEEEEEDNNKIQLKVEELDE